ncbi:MAG TPA: TolC family outer membrane protein [Candidatus Sulfotelmatobacter sp.]|nr:TolC family outer membrane protein [Candidatus Sulfotelmatobacter sp.]
MKALSAVSAMLLAGVALSRPAVAETIEDAMAATYSTNPTLLAQRSALRATDEGASQAGAGWRPTVQFVGNYGKAIQYKNTVVNLSNGETEPLSPNEQTLQLLQPLYLGGRIESQIQSAEALVKAGRAQLDSTEEQVLLQGATAFMDVLRDQAIVGLNKSNVEVLRKQLEATQDRFRVGELTRTDVAQSEAALQGAIAARVQAEGNLVQSRTNYLRVVGRLPEKLVHPTGLPELPTNETDATEIAFKGNPDLLNATYTEESAAYDIDTAFGALLPSVSLEGDLIRGEDQQDRDLVTKQAQVLAKVTVPLYQSGAEYSAVRQKKDVDSQRKMQVAITRDQVRQSVTAAWAAFETARAQIASLREQVRAAEITLDGTIQQAQVGTSTTLDVLTAEQVRLQAQTSLVTADHDEYVAAYTLRQTIGELTARAMALPVTLYDPTVHYNNVRKQLFGTTPSGE